MHEDLAAGVDACRTAEMRVGGAADVGDEDRAADADRAAGRGPDEPGEAQAVVSSDTNVAARHDRAADLRRGAARDGRGEGRARHVGAEVRLVGDGLVRAARRARAAGVFVDAAVGLAAKSAARCAVQDPLVAVGAAAGHLAVGARDRVLARAVARVRFRVAPIARIAGSVGDGVTQYAVVVRCVLVAR